MTKTTKRWVAAVILALSVSGMGTALAEPADARVWLLCKTGPPPPCLPET